MWICSRYFLFTKCRKKNGGDKKNGSDSDSEEDPEKKKFSDQITGKITNIVCFIFHS
jgi:hypothetical protein